MIRLFRAIWQAIREVREYEPYPMPGDKRFQPGGEFYEPPSPMEKS